MMQRCPAFVVVVSCAALLSGSASSVQVNPLSQVLSLLGDLKAKINAEGDKELRAYKEYMEWCDDVEKATTNDIKTQSETKSEEEATIEEKSSVIEVSAARIDKTGGDLSEIETEFQNATQLRERERADFVAAEKELADVLETIEKAMRALKKEAAGGSGSFSQITNAGASNFVAALDSMADAASLSGAERQRLVSLAATQSQTQDSEDESAFGPVYKSRSGGVMDLLEDLKVKATTELSELREAEATAKHNFERTEASLLDERAALTKELKSEKNRKAESAEDKAIAEGEREAAIKLLLTNKAALEETLAACERVDADHKDSVKSRQEELAAVDKAAQILADMAGGAADKTYSLLQLGSGSQLHSREDLAHLELLAIVQHIARARPLPALTQLVVQIQNAMRTSAATSKDAFAKVKSMIRGLIEQLETEAQEDSTKKAYCDEEMAKTSAKKEELTTDLDRVTSKLEKATSRVAKLKDDVKDLQGELSAIASSQAEMDALRKESHDDFVENKEELEKGIKGVRQAIAVLREYYSSKDKAAAAALLQDSEGMGDLGVAPPAMPMTHKSSAGAGAGIINVLELCGSDFAKNLEKAKATEDESLEDYKKMTEENKVAQAAKSEAVKAKTKAYKGLELKITEHASDRDGVDSELSAVLEYEMKLKEKCIGKADSYEERKASRDEQIEALKDAIKSLSVTGSFAQRSSRALRGASLVPGQF